METLSCPMLLPGSQCSGKGSVTGGTMIVATVVILDLYHSIVTPTFVIITSLGGDVKTTLSNLS